MEALLNTTDPVALQYKVNSTISTIHAALQLLVATSTYVNQSWPESSSVMDGDRFDFIIAGGGTAGLVMANRLTEIADWRVLVVEQGGNPSQASTIPAVFSLHTHSEADWDFYAEYDPENSHALQTERIALTRGKVLGGSSSIDHMLYERGNPEDYDNWAAMGNEGWSSKDVLKYFMKQEGLNDCFILNGPTAKYHCSNGPLGAKNQYHPDFEKIENPLMDSYADIGMKRLPDLNGPDIMGTAVSNYRVNTGTNSTRASTAQNYLLPIADRPNLYILKNSLVTNILLENKKAVGACIRLPNGEDIEVFSNLEVIVSTGTFNTPKLLQLSGIGPKNDLEDFGIEVVEDLPVGENLHDHPCIPFAVTGNKSTPLTLDEVGASIDLQMFPMPAVRASYSFTGSSQADIQFVSLYSGASSLLLFYLLYVNFNYNTDLTLSFIRQSSDRDIYFTFLWLARPESTGRVVLQSTNIDDKPLIYQNFLKEESEVKILIEALKKMSTVTETNNFAGADSRVIVPSLGECDNLEYGSDDYYRCYVKTTASTTFHPTGTCKMAPKDQGGVVDARLRVYGISNLRVVDDSIMPAQPCAKTAGVTVMIAEKAADMIKEDHGKQTEELMCKRCIVTDYCSNYY